MFKYFKETQHDDYAAQALETARREFLVACDQLDHWEATKNYRAKQIERLEKYVKENPIGLSTSQSNGSYNEYRVQCSNIALQ